MRRAKRKWLALMALAFLPMLWVANVCATTCTIEDLLGDPATTLGSDETKPCQSSEYAHADLCELAQCAFVTASPIVPSVLSPSSLISGALPIAIPAEPRPPLKPPVV